MEFSSHVIEHMYKPVLFREHMDALLNDNGYVILTCPNGSMSGLFDHPKVWRKLWGAVHPNMISDEYLMRIFDGYNGGIFDERLSQADMASFIDFCKAPMASLSPKTSNLLAVMRKKQ